MGPTAYRRNTRGLRDRQAFEHVRMQAGALVAEVARRLGIARQTSAALPLQYRSAASLEFALLQVDWR